MRLIPYRLPKPGLLLFVLLVCSPLFFQNASQTTVARAKPRSPQRWSRPALQSSSLIGRGRENRAQIGITIRKRRSQSGTETMARQAAEVIAKTGPAFAAAFSMSEFSVDGFVKGRWPMVIDYELESDATAELTIITKDKKHTHVIQLPPTGDQHKQIVQDLPEEFGKGPQVGLLSFQAFKIGSGRKAPARFFLYGLGLGDHAVGSMVIDQLQFQPGSIHPKLKEKASYSFHSRSDFNKVSADFMLVTLSSDGVVRPQLAARKTLENGVRRDESVSKNWDGMNDKGKISLGSHQFHVRVWRSPKQGSDWVFAATRQEVRVE